VLFPLYSQPKLDGMRCVARASGLFSRNGKPIRGVPHVVEQLKSYFAKNPDAILDGELYCDKLKNDFNKIISLVRKADPTLEEIAEAAEVIQYWVYDLGHCGNKKFSERSALIPDICKDRPALVVVPTYPLLGFDDVTTQFESYVAAGYEGQIIRQDEKYENKRTEYLLKHKEFKDAEFEILEVGEGVGNKSGMAGFMVLKLSDDKTFRSNIKGSFEFMRELLKDKASLIGKQATVKFFNYTPDGVPRFPYVTSIRDYE
jgi:ATP-dependent DNA ligase